MKHDNQLSEIADAVKRQIQELTSQNEYLDGLVISEFTVVNDPEHEITSPLCQDLTNILQNERAMTGAVCGVKLDDGLSILGYKFCCTPLPDTGIGDQICRLVPVGQPCNSTGGGGEGPFTIDPNVP
ncbi:MAG: hypothetical protein AAF614_25275 [Chloroflexota bacterium]